MDTEKKQLELDKRYIRMASIWAENSYCQRRKVGALIVKDKMIISDGYNGTPSGFENVCEDENNLTKPYVLHAEANAITKIARSKQQQRRCHDVRHRLTLYRMCKVNHTGRNQTGSLLRTLPPRRWNRTIKTGRNRSYLYRNERRFFSKQIIKRTF